MLRHLLILLLERQEHPQLTSAQPGGCSLLLEREIGLVILTLGAPWAKCDPSLVNRLEGSAQFPDSEVVGL